ncbi:MAG: phosphate uptake regulator PhoU [Nitrososphaerota archaeon]|nr:phosphate uptake regulator PhoU [Aigarchaeota archaeon]MDW8076493.1 phosphate uptake regulator PhoU [Nitrososphaerota archaeon]
MKLGRSALCVTLPKAWVAAVGIKENDYLAVRQTGNSLELSKVEREEGVGSPVCIINVDACIEPHSITRVLIGAYIAGHDTIWLQSKRPFTQKQIEEVNSVTRKLIGVHIADSSENIIIIQNLSNPLRPSMDSSIRRFHNLVMDMLEGAVSMLSSGNQDMIKRIMSIGEECDRLYWLTLRQLIRAASDPGVREALGIKSTLWLLGNRLVLVLLKKAVNLSELIALSAYEIFTNGCGIEKRITEWCADFCTTLKHISQNTIDSLMSKDLLLANKTISQIDNLIGERIEAGEKMASSSRSLRHHLFRIIYAFKEIGLCYRQIAEVAINRSLEESGKFVTIECPPKNSEEG